MCGNEDCCCDVGVDVLCERLLIIAMIAELCKSCLDCVATIPVAYCCKLRCHYVKQMLGLLIVIISYKQCVAV